MLRAHSPVFSCDYNWTWKCWNKLHENVSLIHDVLSCFLSFPSQWSLRNQTENQLCGMLRMFRRHWIPFSLSLRFWHWTSPHTFYAAVCVYVHLFFLSFFKGESIDFPFHFIRYLFYLYVYHYFVVARCVVAGGFNALWLFSFNWNSRHFHACFGKNWQIYLSSNFFGLISSHWEDF